MAHSLQAKKRVRQTVKLRARNRVRKEGVKIALKSFDAAMLAGDAGKAKTELATAVSKLDRVASKHTIHKNAAARKRSRLQKRLNKLAGAKA